MDGHKGGGEGSRLPIPTFSSSWFYNHLNCFPIRCIFLRKLYLQAFHISEISSKILHSHFSLCPSTFNLSFLEFGRGLGLRVPVWVSFRRRTPMPTT
jgi:hypothetical protein